MRRVFLSVFRVWILSGSAVCFGQAGPEVRVRGLEGAAGWVWVEAEDFTAAKGKAGRGDSYSSSGKYPSKIDIAPGSEITYAVDLPMDLGSRAKLYTRFGCDQNRTVTVFWDKDLAPAATMKWTVTPDTAHPSVFTPAIPLRPVSGGKHALTFKFSGEYAAYSMDAFLIATDDVDLPTEINSARNSR